ncbi:DUF481 domain-containing protein [Pontibacter sp. G13]|uniref:DUF481 domain-containing protein n=1 Tax=Pontibacter sp. G13 TaxID=3074898 RepID=UPI00288AEC84|nr:DUF481 domain-containing protein [Pontibacter sp. G13]WNJ17618.1 DUF481 domain-containing protein [Pontibacter sp. G13]
MHNWARSPLLLLHILLTLTFSGATTLWAQSPTVISQEIDSLLQFSTKVEEKDSLYLSNGDRIAGELKTIESSVITFDTDYAESDFKIKWEKVTGLRTNQISLIILADGDRILGLMKADSGQAEILTVNGTIRVPIDQIVDLHPVEEKFWKRIDASLDLNYNFVMDNHLHQFGINGSVQYNGEKGVMSFISQNVSIRQDDVDQIRRYTQTLNAKFYLDHNWFSTTTLEFTANSEQKLRSRRNLKQGIGIFIHRSNKWYWYFSGGIGYNSEFYTDDEQTQRNSGEFVLTTEANIFNQGDLDLRANLSVYPSFTERGRWRSTFTYIMKYELPLDFYISGNLTFNFDNRPVEGASRYDLAAQAVFGWKL